MCLGFFFFVSHFSEKRSFRVYFPGECRRVLFKCFSLKICMKRKNNIDGKIC